MKEWVYTCNVFQLRALRRRIERALYIAGRHSLGPFLFKCRVFPLGWWKYEIRATVPGGDDKAIALFEAEMGAK